MTERKLRVGVADERRVVQIVQVGGQHDAVGVVPGARADARARMDRRAAVLRAQVGAPGTAAGAHRVREVFTDRIRAVEAAEVAVLIGAGDEEGEVVL